MTLSEISLMWNCRGPKKSLKYYAYWKFQIFENTRESGSYLKWIWKPIFAKNINIISCFFLRYRHNHISKYIKFYKWIKKFMFK